MRFRDLEWRSEAGEWAAADDPDKVRDAFILVSEDRLDALRTAGFKSDAFGGGMAPRRVMQIHTYTGKEIDSVKEILDKTVLTLEEIRRLVRSFGSQVQC